MDLAPSSAVRMRALSDAATGGRWLLDTRKVGEVGGGLLSCAPAIVTPENLDGHDYDTIAAAAPADAAWIALTGSQRVREALCALYEILRGPGALIEINANTPQETHKLLAIAVAEVKMRIASAEAEFVSALTAALQKEEKP